MCEHSFWKIFIYSIIREGECCARETCRSSNHCRKEDQMLARDNLTSAKIKVALKGKISIVSRGFNKPGIICMYKEEEQIGNSLLDTNIVL